MTDGMYKQSDIKKNGLLKIGKIRERDWISNKTYAFQIKVGQWNARWRGQVSPTIFNSKGAAEAYLHTCDKAGKLRA